MSSKHQNVFLKRQESKGQSEVISHRIALEKEYMIFISSTNIYIIPTQCEALLLNTRESEVNMIGSDPAALEIMFWGERAIIQLTAQLVVELYL